jgi:Uma2 family endonuclease
MTMARLDTDAPVGSSDASDASVMVDGRRYLRAPVPIRFPEAELVPESKRHLKQRTTLFQILEFAFADRAAIGCDQFVYWDPTDPTRCLAPDAFVRLGRPDDLFKSWKVWERGAPEVAVEILSESDARDRDWEGKLTRYRLLGVQELVCFDPEHEPPSLRVWDFLDGDLVERGVSGTTAQSRYLPGCWVVVADEISGSLLRLSRDVEGTELYPTPAEQAEARVRELEAELKRRG